MKLGLIFNCLLLLYIYSSCKLKESKSTWHHYRGDAQATQFSSLDQIDTTNVHLLKPLWTFHTGDTVSRSTIECNPIIIKDKIYLTSPSLALICVHAVSGKELWRFKPNRIGGINRGVTFYKKDDIECIFFSSGHYMYAVNAQNGTLIDRFGDTGKIDLRLHLGKDTSAISISLTTPGVIYHDHLIIGSATGEGYEASPGHIRAYNAMTGALVWIFHTIPQKGEHGYDTWQWKENENYGGTNDWGGLSLDEEKGVVFVATGSPTYDFYGANRIGENLFANSVIALDANTGKRKWHYQTVKHDIWDYDLPCAPTLANVKINGVSKDILLQPTKMGELILLDRNTGELILKSNEKKVPISSVPGEKANATQSFNQGILLVSQGWDTNNVTTLSDSAKKYVLTQSKKYFSNGMYTPPSLQGTITQPGTRGGMGWSGLSYDAKNKMAYTNCNNFPMLFQLIRLRSKNKNEDKYYEGERIYMLNCASCHGADKTGNNDGMPGLVNIKSKLTTVELRSIIKNGKGLMPPHKQFSDSTLIELIQYLRKDEVIGKDSISYTLDKFVLNGFRIFTDQEGFPANQPPWGTLNAIDIESQKIKWSVPLGYYPKLKERGIEHTGTQNFGGCVATAGGLVFIGATADEMFRAFDANTGKIVWEYKLPAGGYATPSVYEVDGKEYIIIAAGGGNRNNTRSGDSYLVFGL